MISDNPLARSENIVMQELKEEVLICDVSTNRMFCLNKTAAEVWKLCNGNRSVRQIAVALKPIFKEDFSEDLILFTLEELASKNLLVGRFSPANLFKGVSRREAVRRIGFASMVALPVISSLVLPSAVHAQSGTACAELSGRPNGCPCASDSECAGCCNLENGFGNGVCADASSTGCACTSSSSCSSGCCNGDTQRCDSSSSGSNGCQCVDNSDCTSGCCSTGSCSDAFACNCAAQPYQNDCSCFIDSDCQSGCCSAGTCSDSTACGPGGGFCDGTPIQNGCPCASDNVCQSGCCAGGSCADASFCSGGGNCSDTPYSSGCPCGDDSDCESGFCSESGCA